MRDISTDLSCSEHAPGCMTVGPGVYWIEAYKAVSRLPYILIYYLYIYICIYLAQNLRVNELNKTTNSYLAKTHIDLEKIPIYFLIKHIQRISLKIFI